MVAGVLEHVAHEAAVDLQIVHGQLLQIGQRGHAHAEVVQRKTAAQRAQGLDQPGGAGQTGDGAGLGDLEAQQLRRDAVRAQLRLHKVQQPVVVEAGA